MERFSAIVISPRGTRLRRDVAGGSAGEARARLRADGFFVERLKARRPRRPLDPTRLRPAHQVLFFRQMQMLLSAGVLIADSLRVLRDRFPDRRMRRVLGDVYAQVSASRTGLSAALSRFPRSFPPAVIAVVQTGEEAGSAHLAERFGDLADRIAFEAAHRRRIRRACAYPAFVACLSIGVYALLLGVVFPRLLDLLGSLGDRLPPLASAVVSAAVLVRKGALPGTAFVLAAAALVAAARRLPEPGRRLDQLLLRVPVAGTVYRESAVALVCKIYRSLYLANQPAPAILDLCGKVVENRAFRHRLGEARRRIAEEGAPLAAALSATGLFPPLACLAIEVGEQSGQLAAALERVSDHFGARARERLDAAIGVLNPVLTLGVVGGAGLILIAFFQAAYQVAYATH